MENPKFKVGQEVIKYTGDYQQEGEVVGVNFTKAGKVRYVVEHKGGMLHIYSEANLKPLEGSKLERQYLDLLRACVNTGNIHTCRNGNTRAIFAHQIRHNMSDGFPLLTSKKMPWKLILAELLWFIEGGKKTNYRMSNARLREIAGMQPDAKTIWSHDCEKPAWLEKVQFKGDCGRIYGAQWRNWNGKIDQLAKLVDGLIKDPFSRYHKVTAWNPNELGDMCLPPCHGDFQCFVTAGQCRNYLSLHMNQRSCDMFLGVPFNIASYGFLLCMLAKITGLVPYELVITLNDCHVYEGHVDAVTEQLNRHLHPLPIIYVTSGVSNLDDFSMNDFSLSHYECEEPIKATLY